MNLSPEQVTDLRASGLTDTTIAALRFEAVRPADIPIQGPRSAYRIPYFNLDGSKNCFERLKLLPPIKDSKGHSQKYWQPAGSLPRLYLPPLVGWASLARDIKTELVITEGEKKAAAACQFGLIAAGLGGVWNWRLRLDSGDPLMLPILDQIVWKDRRVELVPDSDAWRDDKLLKVLGGFYALGQELLSRGATVRLVQLPERAGVKVGLDDWLVAAGDLWETDWPALERVPFDDPRLAPVTAWWQRWREKQATQTALAKEAPLLTISETAGEYTVRDDAHAVQLVFDRVAEQRGSLSAELSVTLGTASLFSGMDIGLKSDTSQTKLASSLARLAPAVPWKLLLQQSCALVKQHHREGTPLRYVNRDTPTESFTYIVNPLIVKGAGNILYGDGGLGKSSVGLWCALLILAGESIAGIRALRGKPLLLDYEDCEAVHVRRIKAIAAAHPSLGSEELAYQACSDPLWQIAPQLQRRIHREGITCLILDSLLPSTGGDSGSEATTKAFNALRKLGVESLILAHVPKTQQEGQTYQTVYGSVFSQNYARNIWELKREQAVGEDTSVLGLFNRKSNHSRLHLPIRLKVTQNETNTFLHYEPCDLTETAELVSALPAAAQIRNFLEDGEPRTAKAIADATGLKLTTVKTTLSREQGRKWQMLGGSGQETTWCVLGSK